MWASVARCPRTPDAYAARRTSETKLSFAFIFSTLPVNNLKLFYFASIEPISRPSITQKYSTPQSRTLMTTAYFPKKEKCASLELPGSREIFVENNQGSGIRRRFLSVLMVDAPSIASRVLSAFTNNSLRLSLYITKV